MEKIVSNKNNLQILFEDNHIIAINKRCGDIVQGDKTGDTPLSEIIKSFIKEKYYEDQNYGFIILYYLAYINLLRKDDKTIFY